MQEQDVISDNEVSDTVENNIETQTDSASIADNSETEVVGTDNGRESEEETA